MNSYSDGKKLSTYVILVLAVIIGITAVNAELKLVNAIFRHGDRTPDDNENEIYPNDPYLNYSYYPMGRGQLTNAGKEREYELGKFLRNLYKNFLGEIYTPNSVYAVSSDYDRTKMSLQLVLAGLYPPHISQLWNILLRWQPIPAQYLRRFEDSVFLPEDCFEYKAEYDRVLASPEAQQGLSKYSLLMKNLTIWTGKNITRPWDMYYIYHTLMAQYSMKLPLPAWTRGIFPKGELWDATVFAYNVSSSTPLLKKLYGGPFLRIVTRNMLEIATGTQTNENATKIHLFSGHESNVAAVMHAIDVYYPHVPEYSSAVIFELHHINNVYYVKIRNYMGIPAKIIDLRIPGCEILCPIDKFLQHVEEVMPRTLKSTCDKSSTDAFVGIKSVEELELLRYNLIRTGRTV